ncbi:hypothetical protein [Selenomonas ruminantium]|nr:hypothetical protein [Selenomonas ruminantium]
MNSDNVEKLIKQLISEKKRQIQKWHLSFHPDKSGLQQQPH